MQIQRCKDTPDISTNVFFSGEDLSKKRAPVGIYKYVTDKSHHTESVRYIIIGTMPGSRVLLCLNLHTMAVSPGQPNNKTQFIKTDENLIMDITPGE